MPQNRWLVPWRAVLSELTTAYRMLNEATTSADVCRELGLRADRYRWCSQFGGMNADDAKRLRIWESQAALETFRSSGPDTEQPGDAPGCPFKRATSPTCGSCSEGGE